MLLPAKAKHNCALQPVRCPTTHLIHLGLGEHRLIAFIVPIASVAHDVDDDVALPGLPPVGSQLTDAHHGLDIISIHVEDRGVEGLRYVRAVGRAAALLGVRRESHLGTADRFKDLLLLSEDLKDHSLDKLFLSLCPAP